MKPHQSRGPRGIPPKEFLRSILVHSELKYMTFSNESTKVHNARRVHKVVTESDVANVEIISWNCIIILHVNL